MYGYKAGQRLFRKNYKKNKILKKKILIVGGTGFLGYYFAIKCLKNNLKVTSLSRKKPKKKRFLEKVKYIHTDISKKKILTNIIKEEYNFVVNFGGDVDHHGTSTFKSHFCGLKNLAEIFKKKKLDKFIQVGSSVEYGKLKSPHIEGKYKVKISSLKSIYAKAKLSSTNYLVNLYNKEKFPVTIFRPYLIYGPGQDFNRLIPYVIKNCLQNKSFPCSNGYQLRDFIFIDDAINLIFKSLINKKSNGKIFNLCSGKPIKVKKLINDIRKKIKKGKPQFGLIKFRKDEIMNFYGDIKKVRKVFNWKPKNNIEKGISKTIKFYGSYF